MVTLVNMKWCKFASTRNGRILHIVKAGTRTYCGRDVWREESIIPVSAAVCSACEKAARAARGAG